MKSQLFLLLLLSAAVQHVDAQDSTETLKRIAFRITVTGPGNEATKGWLANINDSAVIISNRAINFGNMRRTNLQVQPVDYNRITTLRLKRKNGAGRGALYGAISGLLIGVASGFIAGDDPHVPASQDFFGFGEAFRMTAADKALVGGIAGAAIGSGLGAILGAILRKTFIIEGKKEKFDEMRVNVLDKAYGKN